MRILRCADITDIPAIETLIKCSVHTLQAEHYNLAQRKAALGTVFGVDSQLIADRTYFVVEKHDELIACGGWSFRSTLFGADGGKLQVGQPAEQQTEQLLNPEVDAARIRAFFVLPNYARQGLGKQLLQTCEASAIAYGFKHFKLVATVAGEPLYERYGFQAMERYEVAMSDGEKLPVVAMTKIPVDV